MNPLLTVAYKLSRFPRRPLDVAFVIDFRTVDTWSGEVRRMFGPWSDWARVAAVFAADANADIQGWLDARPGDGAKVLALAGCDAARVAQLTASAKRAGVAVVDSSFPPRDSFDSDLIREIAHHDYEIGGKNEWDGSPTKHGNFVLQLTSRTHSRYHFPRFLMSDLRNIAERLGRPAEALDIGCGAMTKLRWGALAGAITITGIDPLLEVYEVVIARHGLSGLPHLMPSERHAVRIEDFDVAKAEGRFHFVYTSNALDHTQDPVGAVATIRRLMAPDGFALIQVATNEGTRQNWDQLHKFDIFLGPRGTVQARDQRGRTSSLVGSDTPLRLKRVLVNTGESLAFLAVP